MAKIQLGLRRWVHDLWIGKKRYAKLFWWNTSTKQIETLDQKITQFEYNNVFLPFNDFDEDDLIEQYCLNSPFPTLREVRFAIDQNNLEDDPGIYFIDTGGHASCSTPCTLEFDDPPLTVTNETGQDLEDGTVTVHATSDDTPLTYSLNDVDYQASNVFSDLAPGNYTVYVKDSNPDQTCKIEIDFTILPFYGIIYRHIFDESVPTGAREIKVEIGKKDYGGAVTEIAKSDGEQPVTIEYVGDPENKDKVVIGSQCTVSLHDEIGFQFTDLFSTTERDYRVDVYIDNNLIWTGYVLPDSYSEDYIEEPYVARIAASDGLGYLKNIPFLDDFSRLITGRKTQMWVITQCLRKLDLDISLWENLDVYEDSMSETNSDSPLTQAEVNTDLYYDDDGFPFNCYDVLIHNLNIYNAHIVQSGAEFHIIRKPIAGATYRRRKFDLDGNYISDENFNPHLDIDQTQIISVNGDHSLKALSNYKRIIIHYKPQPFRNLIIDGDFEDLAWEDENTLINWTKEGAATLVKYKVDEGYAVSLEDTFPNSIIDATYIESTPVHIVVDEDSQFGFFFQYYIETEDLNFGNAPTPKLYMQLKIGDYYFYDILQEEENSRGGSGTATTISVKFTTVPTLNEIEVDKVNEWQNYGLRIPDLLFGCPAEVISGDVSVRLYQAYNQDTESTPIVRTVFDNVRLNSFNIVDIESAPIQEGDNEFRRRRTQALAPPFINQDFYASIPAVEKGLTYEYPIFHADGPVAESRAAITINDVLTSNWHRKGVSENRELSDLLLQVLVNNNYRPAWLINGSYFGDITIINSFEDSNQPGRIFIPTQGIYDVKARIWNLNLVEIQTTERNYDVWRIDEVPEDNANKNTGGKTNSALNNVVLGGLAPNRVVITDESGQQITTGGAVGQALFMSADGPEFQDVQGGGGGEANTASNLGGGEGVFANKVSVDLQFKSLVEGTNISISSTSTEITISSTGGDNNKVAVDGSATPDFLGAGGNNGVLRTGSNKLSYTDGGNFVTIDVVPGNILTSELNNDALFISLTDISATSGVSYNNTTGVISHADTSTQASVNNSGGTVIQDVTLDGFGHVTGLASVDLDSRYLQSESDTLQSVTDRGASTTNTITVNQSLGPQLNGFVLNREGNQQFATISNDTGGAIVISDISGNITTRIRSYAISGVQAYFNAGNVVIGATTGSEKLTVNGSISGTFAAATTDTDRFLVSDSGVIKYRTGAEVLSDIGGVEGRGNGISNYIAKWSSANGIEDSILKQGTGIITLEGNELNIDDGLRTLIFGIDGGNQGIAYDLNGTFNIHAGSLTGATKMQFASGLIQLFEKVRISDNDSTGIFVVRDNTIGVTHDILSVGAGTSHSGQVVIDGNVSIGRPSGGTLAFFLDNLPTSNPGGSGQVWNDNGTLKIT